MGSASDLCGVVCGDGGVLGWVAEGCEEEGVRFEGRDEGVGWVLKNR